MRHAFNKKWKETGNNEEGVLEQFHMVEAANVNERRHTEHKPPPEMTYLNFQ